MKLLFFRGGLASRFSSSSSAANESTRGGRQLRPNQDQAYIQAAKKAYQLRIRKERAR